MNTSIMEEKAFLKTSHKKSSPDWENPFLLKQLFQNCEVKYQGRVRRPETLFSEYEVTHFNLLFAGALFRLQKKAQKNFPAQVLLIKDDQQTFAELSVDFALGPTAPELHEFIQNEIEISRKKYLDFGHRPHFEWCDDVSSGIKTLVLQLRVSI